MFRHELFLYAEVVVVSAGISWSFSSSVKAISLLRNNMFVYARPICPGSSADNYIVLAMSSHILRSIGWVLMEHKFCVT
jgi:hypothetical protein